MASYWEVAKQAYRQEKQRAASRIDVDQKDFLPAALEVLEKPASPIGRFTIWALALLFVIALIWSIVGKVDVVAVAQGKVVPVGQIKTIQSFESGVVRELFVEDGMHVKQGQLLIRLDTTANGADIHSLQAEQREALLTLNRSQWLLNVIDGLHSASQTMTWDIELSDADIAFQQNRVSSQWLQYQASASAFTEQINEKNAEIRAIQGELSKIAQTLPLLKEQASSLKTLSATGVSSRFEYLQVKEQLIARIEDQQIQGNRIAQLQAAIATLTQQREMNRQQLRNQWIQQIAESSNSRVRLAQELVKAQNTNASHYLKAPVAGVIQQLAIHTIGGVVQASEPLMVIVPAQRTLQVEANILNKDIGFVETGQGVEIKLDAFPFTKYGVIHGDILSIDLDAVNDQQIGLVFPSRISMQADHITMNNRQVSITPGMSVSVEIKLGKRRIVEFILAPLFRYKSESFRER